MLLWTSSGESDVLLGEVAQDGEQIASNVALEAADHFSLRHPRGRPARHVPPRTWVVTEPDDDNAMECGISSPIASSIESVTVGIA